MKLNKLILIFGLILILNLVIVNADVFDDAYKIPEKVEYEKLHTELNTLAKSFEGYNSAQGRRVRECYLQFQISIDSIIMEYQEGLGVRNSGIQNCAKDKTNYFPEIAKYEKRFVACIRHVANPIDKVYYNKLIEQANNAELCIAEQKIITIGISLSENKLVANGMSKTEITAILLENGQALSGDFVGFVILDEDDELEDDGLLSAESTMTNEGGQGVIEYTAPVINDPEFDGIFLKIQAAHKGQQFKKDIELLPAPLITGKVLNIDGQNFEDVPIKYNFRGSSFINEILTNENGEFFIPGKEGEECVITIGQGFGDYLTIIKRDISSPNDFGTFTLATKRQYEKNTAMRVINFLVKAGIDKAEANEMVNGLTIEYDQGGPEFYVEDPSFFRKPFMSGWASLRIPNEQYWSQGEWDTIYHEYTHVIMRRLAFDEDANVGKQHDIWQKSHPDTAFDEARGHFVSILLLKQDKRYINDEFTEIRSRQAMKDELSDRGQIEGAVTSFWKQKYGNQINTCPSCVLKDFLDVQDKYKAEHGRPPRTLDEWLKVKSENGDIIDDDDDVSDDDGNIVDVPKIEPPKVDKPKTDQPDKLRTWDPVDKPKQDQDKKTQPPKTPPKQPPKTDNGKDDDKSVNIVMRVIMGVVDFFKGLFS